MLLVYLDLYHCFNETIFPQNGTIMKIGIAGFSGCDDMAKAKLLYPNSKTIAYEADPKNYNAMKDKADGCIDSFTNKAVGSSGTMKLYRFKNSVSHSVYPRHLNDKNCVFVDNVVVPSITLNSAMIENGIDRISLLILNCEGGELPILMSLVDQTIRNKIDQICVSFHDPRIYPVKKREKVMAAIGKYYHIVRGVNCQKGGIPDWLLMRKV